MTVFAKSSTFAYSRGLFWSVLRKSLSFGKIKPDILPNHRLLRTTVSSVFVSQRKTPTISVYMETLSGKTGVLGAK
jgi:hypothetical protein